MVLLMMGQGFFEFFITVISKCRNDETGKKLSLHHTPSPFLNFFRSLPPKEVIKKGAPNYDITYIYLQPYLT